VVEWLIVLVFVQTPEQKKKKKKKRMASLYESHSIIVLFSFLEKGMKYCLLQVTT
jgi:hypothetical protein